MESAETEEKSSQTLRPIPIEDVNNLETYNISCVKCDRMWIVSSQEILMYEAFKRTGDGVEKTRICFECGAEKIRKNYVLKHEKNDYRNENAWMKCKVLISEFRCCACGNSCDVNFKVTDNFVGKIPFFRYCFKKRHQFCCLCFENVKSGIADSKGRIILDPKQCRRNHGNADEDSDVELLEDHFAK